MQGWLFVKQKLFQQGAGLAKITAAALSGAVAGGVGAGVASASLDDSKKCKKCGAVFNKKYKKCPECGEKAK